MADNTHIEWADATWNPVTGCSVVSPGCTNCYAMKLAGTRLKHVASRQGLTRDTKAGPVWTGEVRFNEAELVKPLSWRRPRVIFVCAHGDLFAEGVPDAWIDEVFGVMAFAPQHTFLVLTKRAARMRQYVEGLPARRRDINCHPTLDSAPWPLPNVWLGVSAEDQKRADERIPDLLATPSAKRFVSLEPLLGAIDLYNGAPDPRLGGHQATHTFIGDWWEPGDDPKGPSRHGIDWVIVGGESQAGARPMHPAWARSLRDQCVAAEVPFFFKQWGVWGEHPLGGGDPLQLDGRIAGTSRTFEEVCADTTVAWISRTGRIQGRLLDGREWNERPELSR